MRLLVPDGARRRQGDLLPCREETEATTMPPASPAPPSPAAGRTVVVGIRRDAASRELLTWALVKVANAGDRVVALHVAAMHVAAAPDGLLMGVDERSRAADSLASVLAVYDGFCNLKQPQEKHLTFLPASQQGRIHKL